MYIIQTQQVSFYSVDERPETYYKYKKFYIFKYLYNVLS